MEDMGNYGYTLFRTIPLLFVISTILWCNLLQITQQYDANYQVITMKLHDNYYHFTQRVIANNTQKCQYSAHEVLAFLLAKGL